MKNLTVFFTYYCDSALRRKYIELCLSSLFQSNSDYGIPVIVVDGSPKKDFLLNRKLFSKCKNLNYIHDTEINPFKRCEKYLNEIKTRYVLRLLEDIVFVHRGDFFERILKDIALLDFHADIDAVHYLMVDDSKYISEGNTLYYEKLNFENMKHFHFKNWLYFNFREKGWLYHYLCNNLLYKRDLFIRQWKYLSKNYLTHNSAEAGNMNIWFYNLFANIRYIRGLIRFMIRLYEKIFHKKEIINSIVLTETLLTCDILHIGYCRIESVQPNYNPVTFGTTLQNLEFFRDINFLSKVKFKRLDSSRDLS